MPNISNTSYYFDSVDACVYNIFKSGTGEIISGRVTDAGGDVISDALVTASRSDGGTYTATTNDRGIYALPNVPSGSIYVITVTKPGYSFTILTVNTGISADSVPNTGYRSFDRQWLLADSRLLDRPSPDLWRSHSDRQVYLTSLLTKVLGEGPAAVATSLIPDMDYFCNRGARDVIPLWRDSEATEPNVTAGTLEALAQAYGQPVTAADLFAYCYAVLCSPDYVHRFWDELTIPGPRLPLTRDAARFPRVADLGRRLLWLHTYGERFIPPGHKPGRIPPGQTRCLKGTPAAPEKYPDKFFYDLAGRQLHVGEGVFGPVRPEVWEFSVSGFQVVQHWLAHRMKKGAGKKSSPLDKIRPAAWQFDEELLDLLWVLEHTVDLWPSLAQSLNDILTGDLFTAPDFPEPRPEERGAKGHLPLLGAIASDETEAHENDG